MKSPTHVLCRCPGLEGGAVTEIDRDLSLMDCAQCGSTSVELVCIVACPTEWSKDRTFSPCSLPFHDYERDCHVVPWEQRDMLSLAGE